MPLKYRITDIRAFEEYYHPLKILGAEKIGDELEYQDLPIFEILLEKGWISRVKTSFEDSHDKLHRPL